MNKPNTFTIRREFDGYTAEGFAKYLPEKDTWEVTVTSGFGVKEKRRTDNVLTEFEDMLDLAIEADREKYMGLEKEGAEWNARHAR